MSKINLRDLHPNFYTSDYTIPAPDQPAVDSATPTQEGATLPDPADNVIPFSSEGMGIPGACAGDGYDDVIAVLNRCYPAAEIGKPNCHRESAAQ